MKTVIVTDPKTQIPIRMRLPDPCWKGDHSISTGISLVAFYWRPIACQLIAEIDSAWQDRNGFRTGSRYELVEPRSELAATACEYVSEEIADHVMPIQEEVAPTA